MSEPAAEFEIGWGWSSWRFEALRDGLDFAGNFEFPGPDGFVYRLTGAVGYIKAIPTDHVAEL